MPEKRATHGEHPHRHDGQCGHTAIRHGDHVDCLHEGHLHHQKGDEVEEHRIEVNDENPERCTPDHRCAHGTGEQHGEAEPEHDHPAIPHGDHVDHLHEGRLHHHHGDHCDDHGSVEVLE